MHIIFRTPKLLVLLLMLVSGCYSLEEEIISSQPKLVVDGTIEQGEFPEVYLTLTSGFYDPVDSVSLLDLVVTTAYVAVSDGENEEVLTLFRNKGYFPPFYYRGTSLRGEAGKTYTLEVRSQGETYRAETTIPQPQELDSVWFEKDPEVDTLGRVWIRLMDDATQQNYYRYFTQVIGKDEKYLPAFQSTLSDRTFDGMLFSHPVLKQPESFSDIGDDVLFTRGDSISIRFCTLDRTHFEFWRTLERELYTAGNPFGSVGNEVASNITGTRPALGIWGGYGATYYRIRLE